MVLNDKLFPQTAAQWLKEAAWEGEAVRHNGRMYRRLSAPLSSARMERNGANVKFADPSRSDMKFLVDHGFILYGNDGDMLVLDVERDDDGYGE